jgi:hypothetical protein
MSEKKNKADSETNISDMRNLEVTELDVSHFAYPHTRCAGFEQYGMTKKEEYAKAAMQVILIDRKDLTGEYEQIYTLKGEIGVSLRAKVFDLIAKASFEMAEKMLKYSDIDVD